MSILPEIRKQLLKMGASETDDAQDNMMLQAMWVQMQELRAEMNQAKKDAAAKEKQRQFQKLEKQLGM